MAGRTRRDERSEGEAEVVASLPVRLGEQIGAGMKASSTGGNVVKLRARPPLEGAVSEADWGSSWVLETNRSAERC